MLHLREIRLNTAGRDLDSFPFNLKIVGGWAPLELISPVTFLVGENGTGKSTLLEALAAAVGSITVGAEPVSNDPTMRNARLLGKAMRLAWHARTRKGFFLRAEDYFGFVKRIDRIKAELEQDLRAVDEEYLGRSALAKGLAKMPYARELHNLKKQYGDGLDTQSHGESFLALFQARFVPGGLYLLDEPEAALSPLRQLAFLSLLKEMVAENAQFIIATHAPIIMAYPGAQILSFNDPPVQPVSYDDLEHVTLTRDFLNNPDRFLRHL